MDVINSNVNGGRFTKEEIRKERINFFELKEYIDKRIQEYDKNLINQLKFMDKYF